MTASPLAELSPQDLARLAAGIEIPSDLPFSDHARAFIDVRAIGPEHRLQDPCTHTTVYQVVFGLDGGRRDVPAGPAFADHAAATALVQLLNHVGEPDAPPSPEPVAPRTCAVCGTALPAGSRAHRKTCSETCRQRLARERRSAGAQTGGAARAPTPPGWAVGPGDASIGPLAESLGAPAESVTTRPAAPAAQLAMFALLPDREGPAAVVMPAGPEPEVRHDRTAPTS
jgi:predicted nucleic acid-binding Zn ribbon protein